MFILISFIEPHSTVVMLSFHWVENKTSPQAFVFQWAQNLNNSVGILVIANQRSVLHWYINNKRKWGKSRLARPLSCGPRKIEYWLTTFLPVISNWYKISFKLKNRKRSSTESRCCNKFNCYQIIISVLSCGLLMR